MLFRSMKSPEMVANAIADAAGTRVVRMGRSGRHVYRIVSGTAIYDVSAATGESISADLKKRDFSINAMAVSLETGALIDPTGGLADLESRVVRMVSVEAFDADPLRMLRAFRFCATLHFSVDAETLASSSLSSADAASAFAKNGSNCSHQTIPCLLYDK